MASDAMNAFLLVHQELPKNVAFTPFLNVRMLSSYSLCMKEREWWTGRDLNSRTSTRLPFFRPCRKSHLPAHSM